MHFIFIDAEFFGGWNWDHSLTFIHISSLVILNMKCLCSRSKLLMNLIAFCRSWTASISSKEMFLRGLVCVENIEVQFLRVFFIRFIVFGIVIFKCSCVIEFLFSVSLYYFLIFIISTFKYISPTLNSSYTLSNFSKF